MTKEQELALKKDRYNRLTGSLKNLKAPGVTKKLKRQIRNMESK